MLLILILAGALVGVSALRWRWSVQAGILLTIFEGALRKWVLPGASEYLYFLKDIVFLGAYLGFLFDSTPGRGSAKTGLTSLVGIGCLAVILQAFNPNHGSFLSGLIGLKPYLWYVPLFWLIPCTFTDRASFSRFLHVFVFLSLPVGLLGIAQFSAPLDSELNAYAQKEAHIIGFGEDNLTPQITGTFAFISGYTSFLLIAFALGLALLITHKKVIWQWGLAGVLFLMMGNMFMTGSRKTMVFVAIYLIILVVVVVKNWSSFSQGAQRALLTMVVAGVASVSVFSSAATVLKTRAEGAEDFGERIELIGVTLKSIGQAGMFGYGAGLSHPGTAAINGALKLPPAKSFPDYMDLEMNQVLLELGIIGFLAWYFMKLALLYGLWMVSQEVRNPQFKVLAAGAFAFHLAHLYLSVYLNHTANVYYWFTAGFILLLPQLDAIGLPAVSAFPRRSARARRGRRPGFRRGRVQPARPQRAGPGAAPRHREITP